jgi:von Willebrand factor
LTGIKTKGGEYGWIKTFLVLYSQDEIIWNKLLDETGQPKQFLGNFDSETVKNNFFASPVNARYLKVQPIKWHNRIELKIEPIGCFEPYRELNFIFIFH